MTNREFLTKEIQLWEKNHGRGFSASVDSYHDKLREYMKDGEVIIHNPAPEGGNWERNILIKVEDEFNPLHFDRNWFGSMWSVRKAA